MSVVVVSNINTHEYVLLIFQLIFLIYDASDATQIGFLELKIIVV